MGFFGIGGSKKKSDASDGVVHDSKKDAQQEGSNDILEEFEKHFSDRGPSNASDQQGPSPTQDPDRPVPDTLHSAGSPNPDAPPVPPAPPPPAQPQPSRSQPSGQSQSPGRSQPSGQSQRPPERSAPGASYTPPAQSSAPAREQATSAPAPREPHPQVQDAQDHDLPDFDFDFKAPQESFEPRNDQNPPDQGSLMQDPLAQPPASQGTDPRNERSQHLDPAQPTDPTDRDLQSTPRGRADPSEEDNWSFTSAQTDAQPAPPSEPRTGPQVNEQTNAQIDVQEPPQPVRDPRPAGAEQPGSASTTEHSDFELPDVNKLASERNAQPEPQRGQKPSWLDDSWKLSNTAEEQSKSVPQADASRDAPEKQDSRPGDEQQSRPDVIMRDGTLFIEKHVLMRHVNDLSSLRGLSKETNDKFSHIDSFSKDEKKLLGKIQTSVQALHDNLEQVDELLFSGD